jgi:hypothetical protein
MVVMHLETERIFMNVALYRHVLVCGAPGCTTFVGRNSSLEDAQVKTVKNCGNARFCCVGPELLGWVREESDPE